MDSFDYVIVGGGTAGCVLAARLSKDPAIRVALLEAGAATGPERMADPSAAFTLWGTEVDWGYSTTPQQGTGGAQHLYPLGRVLGGSSSINAMLHLRGVRADYDTWERLGANGWNYASLLPYFRRSERVDGRDSGVHDADGAMTIEAMSTPGPLLQAWLQAAEEEGYGSIRDEGQQTEGHARADMNVVKGRRQSAADAYLRPVLDRPNLTVISRALVRRLLMDGKRCCGAEYVCDEQINTVYADREVLLSAGAIGSPHLLMLSGIGNPDDLREANISAVLDLPGVGQNLHDHVIGGVVYKSKRPLDEGAPFANLPFVLCRSDAKSDADLQLVLNPGPWAPRWSQPDVVGYSIMFALMRPASRGSVRVVSADPATPPLIDPALLSDRVDVDRMVQALRLARSIGERDALTPWREAEVCPGGTVSDDESIRNFVRGSASTYFHPVGTCRIGTDELAVVDSALRVHGIDRLRIVDASVMPATVSANTNATVLAIAERAAAFLLGEEVALARSDSADRSGSEEW